MIFKLYHNSDILDDFTNTCKKKNSRGHFREILDELLNSTLSLYLNVLCKDFLKVDMRR